MLFRSDDDGYKSSIGKFFREKDLEAVADVFDAETGDLILIVSDKAGIVFDTLGFLRRHIAGIMGLLDDNRYELLWITEFPMFEKNDDTGGLKAMHHPFTHPLDRDIPLLDSDPIRAKADAYDIVINGYEAAGGSIRIHEAELQNRMFEILGLTEEECRVKFGFLLDAFKFGAPPHGGIAYGLDRLVMLLTSTKIGRASCRERV